MPTLTFWVVFGSWLLLAGLSFVAYRFLRRRSDKYDIDRGDS